MPSPNSQENENFDVVVVGASFAGLSFASVGAALGLRVLVLAVWCVQQVFSLTMSSTFSTFLIAI